MRFLWAIPRLSDRTEQDQKTLSILFARKKQEKPAEEVKLKWTGK